MTQQDFEFMSHRRGLNLNKRNSAYEDGKQQNFGIGGKLHNLLRLDNLC